MIEETTGEQLKVLGSVTFGAGSEEELVEVKGQAEGGVSDATFGPHHPALQGNNLLQ